MLLLPRLARYDPHLGGRPGSNPFHDAWDIGQVTLKAGPEEVARQLLPATRIGELVPGGSFDYVVHHLLTEKGDHNVE